MAVSDAPQVRVRIAPSPTGFAHLGTASTTLYNVLFARANSGTFALRIDDTDVERNREEYERLIYEALHWLGFDWDEGPDKGGPFAPYRQSERLDTYRPHVDKLLADGRAYLCWCTPERLARMLIPDDAPLSFNDLIRGDVNAPRPDDQVILKADGFPTYHLAVVVDDHSMRISHVIRGEEWISSTPKHLLLYDWLGWQRPEFAHFPLLRNTDHSKISKRKNPAARLKWFQEQGYLPAALVNFLALMGYSMPDGREVFSFGEMADEFSLSRVNAVGPVFDLDKLDWLNGVYLRALSDKEFLRAAEPFLPAGVSASDLHWVLTAVQERTKRLAELPEQLDWLAGDVAAPLPELTSQLDQGAAADVLGAVAATLDTVQPFEPEPIEEALNRLCAERGVNRRRMFMTVRVAVTGKCVSPPLHETIAALGRARSVNRLLSAASQLTSPP